MIVLLLLLLSVPVCTGYREELKMHGQTVKLWVPSRTEIIKFIANRNSETVIWSRSGSHNITNTRGKKSGSYFTMDYVTQQDEGTYIALDRRGSEIEKYHLEVVANQDTMYVFSHDSFSYSFDLAQSSCNIDFTEIVDGIEQHTVNAVVSGRRQDYVCSDFVHLKPCDISIDDITTNCNGRFEVKDNLGNTAWILNLEVQPRPIDYTAVIVSVAVIAVLIICCCCCVKRCCGKSSSKKEDAATDEPVQLVAQRAAEPSRPFETPYPTHPYSSTSPLIHNPTVNAPPSYTQVPAPAEPAHAPTLPSSYTPYVPASTDPTVPLSYHPSVPPLSDQEPRFEMKGYTASPLSSGSTYDCVYTSHNLNFL